MELQFDSPAWTISICFPIKWTRHPWPNHIFGGTSVWLPCVYDFYTISHQIDEAPLAELQFLWKSNLLTLHVRFLYVIPSNRRGPPGGIALFGELQFDSPACIPFLYDFPSNRYGAPGAITLFVELQFDSPACRISIRFPSKWMRGALGWSTFSVELQFDTPRVRFRYDFVLNWGGVPSRMPISVDLQFDYPACTISIIFQIKYTRRPWRNCTFCGTSVWLPCMYDFYMFSYGIDEAPLAESHFLWNFSLTPLHVPVLYAFLSNRQGTPGGILLCVELQFDFPGCTISRWLPMK